MRYMHVAALVPGLLLVADLGAQEPTCPPAPHTVESFKERLVEIATPTPGARATIIAMVSAAFAPVCPVFREGIDLAEALDELVRFVASSGDPQLAGPFHGGLSLALRASPEEGRSPPAMPMAALRFAVESSPLPGPALMFLRRHADDPGARGFLLELMRRERGPPTRPDLPAGLVEVLVRFPSSPFGDLRDALEASPEMIRNPEARRLLGLDPVGIPRLPSRDSP